MSSCLLRKRQLWQAYGEHSRVWAACAADNCVAARGLTKMRVGVHLLCAFLVSATAWGLVVATDKEGLTGGSKAVFLAVQHQRKPLNSTSATVGTNGRALIGVQVPSSPVQLGQYYITLMIGQPAQRINAVIDTGSGIVHAACTGCKSQGCKQVNTPFKPSLSNTLQHVGCASSECTLVCTKAGKHQSLCSNLQACATSSCNCGHQDRCEFEVDYADGSSSSGALLTDMMYLAVSTDVGTTHANASQHTLGTGPSLARSSTGLSYERISVHSKKKGPKGHVRSAERTTIPLVFGCDDYASQYTYDPAVPMYAGFSFQPGSLFSQLVAGGLASEPVLALCLGDGTPATSGQTRRKLLGKAQAVRTAQGVSLSQGSPGVVVVGYAQPHNLKMLAGVAELLTTSNWVRPDDLQPPGLWLHLTSITLANAPTNYAKGTPPLSVLLDSGTTGSLLPNTIWRGLFPDLKDALKRVSATKRLQIDEQQGYIRVHTDRDLTTDDLDKLYPQMMFGFAAASNSSCLQYSGSGASSSSGTHAEVRLPVLPSKYMLMNIEGNLRDWIIFMGNVGQGGDVSGILGNAFLNGVFVQADARCGGAALGLVDSCDQITFT